MASLNAFRAQSFHFLGRKDSNILPAWLIFISLPFKAFLFPRVQNPKIKKSYAIFVFFWVISKVWVSYSCKHLKIPHVGQICILCYAGLHFRVSHGAKSHLVWGKFAFYGFYISLLFLLSTLTVFTFSIMPGFSFLFPFVQSSTWFKGNSRAEAFTFSKNKKKE